MPISSIPVRLSAFITGTSALGKTSKPPQPAYPRGQKEEIRTFLSGDIGKEVVKATSQAGPGLPTRDITQKKTDRDSVTTLPKRESIKGGGTWRQQVQFLSSKDKANFDAMRKGRKELDQVDDEIDKLKNKLSKAPKSEKAMIGEKLIAKEAQRDHLQTQLEAQKEALKPFEIYMGPLAKIRENQVDEGPLILPKGLGTKEYFEQRLGKCINAASMQTSKKQGRYMGKALLAFACYAKEKGIPESIIQARTKELEGCLKDSRFQPQFAEKIAEKFLNSLENPYSQEYVPYGRICSLSTYTINEEHRKNAIYEEEGMQMPPYAFPPKSEVVDFSKPYPTLYGLFSQEKGEDTRSHTFFKAVFSLVETRLQTQKPEGEGVDKHVEREFKEILGQIEKMALAPAELAKRVTSYHEMRLEPHSDQAKFGHILDLVQQALPQSS